MCRLFHANLTLHSALRMTGVAAFSPFSSRPCRAGTGRLPPLPPTQMPVSMGSPNVAFKVNLGRPRNSTINRKSRRSDANALPRCRLWAARGPRGGKSGAARDRGEPATLRAGEGASVPTRSPHTPPPRTPRPCSRAWRVGASFSRGPDAPPPGKLKT